MDDRDAPEPLPRELIQRFVRHLASVAAEVVTLESRLSAADCAVDRPLDELRIIAHKLSGTADAFGFPALGVKARLLEEAITSHRDLPRSPDNNIREFLEALESAVLSDTA